MHCGLAAANMVLHQRRRSLYPTLLAGCVLAGHAQGVFDAVHGHRQPQADQWLGPQQQVLEGGRHHTTGEQVLRDASLDHASGATAADGRRHVAVYGMPVLRPLPHSFVFCLLPALAAGGQK